MTVPKNALRSALSVALLLRLAATATAGIDPPDSTTNSPTSRWCELGVAMALSGNTASAESAFVALLARAPGSSSALNNLGNLHLERGDPDLALQFYFRAGRADTADAGIMLNAGVALAMSGDEASALAVTEEALLLAGSPDSAASLLGLSFTATADTVSRAANPSRRMNRERALDLLRAAAHRIPADSTRVAPTPAAARPKRAPPWRPAGARGSEAGDERLDLYWKCDFAGGHKLVRDP